MKILRLDLRAFGPFTGLSLDLSAGAEGFHLIYGPNEAGKSSALRALGQFFYGIPGNSADDFRHPFPKLRVGALLARRDGRQLELLRRKGTKGTLLGPDDKTPVEEAELRSFLGGCDRSQFESMFGIDHQTLVAGGLDILRGHGEVGHLLFAAGAGIADLRAIRGRLEKEADDLFSPRGIKPAVNQSLAALKAARQKIREAQLPSAEWVSHKDALAEAGDRLEKTEDKLQNLLRERSRIDRIARVLPAIGRLRQIEGLLAKVDHVPILPDDFAENRRETVAGLETARKAEQEAIAEIERLDAERARLVVPDNVLARAEAIEETYLALSVFRKAQGDLPALAAKRESLEQSAAEILRQLRPDLSLEDAAVLRLTRRQQVEIQNLGNRKEALEKQLEKARTEIVDLQRRLQEATGQAAELPPPRDAAALGQSIRQAQSDGDLDRQRAEARAELDRLQQQADVDCNKLGLWQGTLDALEKLALPSPETIDRFDRSLLETQSATIRLQEGLDKVQAAAADVARQIEQLRLEGEVPSEDDLAEARRLRDLGWRLVLRQWRSEAAHGEGLREFLGTFDVPGSADQQLPDLPGPMQARSASEECSPSLPGRSDLAGGVIRTDGDLSCATASQKQCRESGTDTASAKQWHTAGDEPGVPDLAGRYEQAVRKADDLADRLRREANRVATRATLQAQRLSLQPQIAELTAQLADARLARQQPADEWVQGWRPLAIEPLPPREMRAWLRRQQALVEQAQAIRGRLAAIGQLDERIAAHRRQLQRRLAEYRGTALESSRHDDEPLAALLAQCEAVRTEIDAAENARRQSSRDIAKLTQSLSAAQAKAEQADAELAQWHSQWTAALEPLGLEGDAAPAAVNEVVSQTNELFVRLQEAKTFAERIEAIDLDARRFRQDVEQLARSVDPDRGESPVQHERAVEDLYARLRRATADREHLALLTAQRKQQKKKQDAASETVKEMNSLVAVFCQEAGCGSADELPAAERASSEAAALRKGLNDCREELVRLGAGLAIEALTAEADAVHADELPAEIQKLDGQISELQGERDLLRETIGGEKAVLATMDPGAAAADAAEEVQSVLARIEPEVRQYLRLRLASAVLREGIERYRKKNEGPVLARASDLFRRLTLGSFEGLRIAFDAKDEQVLAGIRPGNEVVLPPAMSEGTSDQLYLALRLASLETWLQHNEPMPLIVDDILISFDNDRAVATLEVLAELSRQTQVIFFAHHVHLIELARQCMPADVLRLHHLVGGDSQGNTLGPAKK